MGALFSKGKPVENSARAVMARRSEVLPTIPTMTNTADSAVSNSASGGISKASSRALGSENTEFSPEAIRNMSQWGALVKSTTLKVPPLLLFYAIFLVKTPTVRGGQKIEMASMIRHAEDSLKIKANQGIAGRLSEAQIVQLFSELRFTSRTFRELALELLIKEEDVGKLSRIARMPVIYTDKLTDEILAR